MKKIKQILLLTLTVFLVSTVQAKAATYTCGQSFNRDDYDSSDICDCDSGSFQYYDVLESAGGRNVVSVDKVCCGTLIDGDYYGGKQYKACSGTTPSVTTAPTGTTTPNPTALPVPDSETLDSLNPLKIAGGDETLSTPGGFISKAVNSFVFPIAGIILFLMLVFGGFQMLLGAANKKSLDEGKQRVTSAIIGFIILFASYWIIQLIELIFGFSILG